MRFIPNFKGFDFFPHDLRLPFMRYKGLCLALSIIGMALSLLIIGVKGFNYGVDFKGGSMLEVQSVSGPADIAALREKLGKLGLGAVQIQQFGAPSDVLIRIEQQPGGDAEQQAALKKAADALAGQYTQRRVEVVGPAVSGELRMTGFIAVFAGLLAIVAYVWFRFEWQFALGAIVALTHDVLLVAGIFSLLHLEFDLSIVAALLTILGYSVNDTVVVSDRIRENLRKFKRMDLNELLNLSINETLSRTILTGVTAIVVLISLYIFGGEVIRNFNLAMLLGVVIGTYSSIFIAAPLLGLPGRQARMGGDGSQADRRQRRAQGPAREPGPQMNHGIGALPWAGADRCLRQRRLPLRRDEPSRLDPVPAERHLCLAADPPRRAGAGRICAGVRREGRARAAAARHRPPPGAAGRRAAPRVRGGRRCARGDGHGRRLPHLQRAAGGGAARRRGPAGGRLRPGHEKGDRCSRSSPVRARACGPEWALPRRSWSSGS